MVVDFHGLYERYADGVYRFALYLSGDAALAEDIAQETFVRAWVTPGEIRVGTVKAYLFMIARNLYRAELKRRSRGVPLDDNVPDPRPGPEAAAVVQGELLATLTALQELPELDRSALLMHVHDGLPHAEVAAVLGLSPGAVKVRIHRARLKLHKLIRMEKGK